MNSLTKTALITTALCAATPALAGNAGYSVVQGVGLGTTGMAPFVVGTSLAGAMSLRNNGTHVNLVPGIISGAALGLAIGVAGSPFRGDTDPARLLLGMGFAHISLIAGTVQLAVNGKANKKAKSSNDLALSVAPSNDGWTLGLSGRF